MLQGKNGEGGRAIPVYGIVLGIRLSERKIFRIKTGKKPMDEARIKVMTEKVILHFLSERSLDMDTVATSARWAESLFNVPPDEYERLSSFWPDKTRVMAPK